MIYVLFYFLVPLLRRPPLSVGFVVFFPFFANEWEREEGRVDFIPSISIPLTANISAADQLAVFVSHENKI